MPPLSGDRLVSHLDEALARLTAIRAELAALGPDDPRRPELEAQRTEIQEEARLLADASRNPEYLALELQHLEARLVELERTQIKPSLMERRRVINDPSAYAHGINRKIIEANRAEIESLERRIGELRQALGRSAEDSPSSRSTE